MSLEIIVALIGFAGAVIGAVVTLFLGLRKIRIDQERLEREFRESQRGRLEARRSEIRDFLKLFDRAAFSPIDYDEDPTAALNAIRSTRIALQAGGASLT